jgi:hypothetical protein
MQGNEPVFALGLFAGSGSSIFLTFPLPSRLGFGFGGTDDANVSPALRVLE